MSELTDHLRGMADSLDDHVAHEEIHRELLVGYRMSAHKDEVLSEQTIFAIMLQHKQVTGPFFNIVCSCGYFGKTVSENGDFEKHVAGAIAEGLRKGTDG